MPEVPPGILAADHPPGGVVAELGPAVDAAEVLDNRAAAAVGSVEKSSEYRIPLRPAAPPDSRTNGADRCDDRFKTPAHIFGVFSLNRDQENAGGSNENRLAEVDRPIRSLSV
jgi:hypothetical protein